MRARIFCSGTDGAVRYAPGDECDRDSEWLRRALVNGLAEPLDDEANALVNNERMVRRYSSPSLVAAARARGREDADIPSVGAEKSRRSK